MNYASEWNNFFDEHAGRYRFKHKGLGVVRDTLMALGNVFKKSTAKVVKKNRQSGR